MTALQFSAGRVQFLLVFCRTSAETECGAAESFLRDAAVEQERKGKRKKERDRTLSLAGE